MTRPVIVRGPITLDGVPGYYRARCPGCGVVALLDPDQYHGRVSIQCDCGYHETHDLSHDA